MKKSFQRIVQIALVTFIYLLYQTDSVGRVQYGRHFSFLEIIIYIALFLLAVITARPISKDFLELGNSLGAVYYRGIVEMIILFSVTCFVVVKIPILI